MKKVSFLLLLFIVLGNVVALAQSTPTTEPTANNAPPEDSLPYKKYPTLPAFKILEMDSTTIFNTYNIPEGKPTVLMLFSPDCEHCQHLTEKLTKGMDSLKDIQFYLVTPVSSMTELREFYNKNHLGNYKNIEVVGRDYQFFFFSFYDARFVPYLAIYDKHKKLIKAMDSNLSVKELYELTHK